MFRFSQSPHEFVPTSGVRANLGDVVHIRISGVFPKILGDKVGASFLEVNIIVLRNRPCKRGCATEHMAFRSRTISSLTPPLARLPAPYEAYGTWPDSNLMVVS